jgi:large subunit ribosomal protein L24
VAPDSSDGVDDSVRVNPMGANTHSRKARKQRKAKTNAALHQRRRMVSAHLDSALMREYNVRSVPVRKGDTVKVVRGAQDLKGSENKVASVDLNKYKIVIENITVPKADGTQTERPVDPSDVVITKLDLSDGWRKRKLDSLKGGA